MDTVDDMTELESLPVEQLVELIREKTGAGVNLSFPGKVLARQLGRRVRPRTMRTVKAHSAGTKVLCVDTKASFIIEPEARRKLLVDLNLPITRGDSLQPVPHLGLVHITRVLLRRRAHRLTQHHRHPARHRTCTSSSGPSVIHATPFVRRRCCWRLGTRSVASCLRIETTKPSVGQGHARPSITLDRFGHLSKEGLAPLMAKIDALVAPLAKAA